MSRLENGSMTPPTLFMGLTVVAVAGAAVYFATREDEDTEEAQRDDSGTEEDDAPIGGGTEDAPSIVAVGEWNTTLDGKNVVSLEHGKVYTSTLIIPAQLVDPNGFRINIVGDIEITERTNPKLSNLPNAGVSIELQFVPKGSGSIQFVWPKNGQPGEGILTQYRRLNIVVSTVA